MSEQNNGGRNIKDVVQAIAGVGKDVVALLRDSVLFILALLLLAFPTTFNQTLSSAGFEEGSFVGLKWKPKLIESDDKLKEAQTALADLQAQNARLTTALAEAQQKLNDPALKTKFAEIQEANKEVSASAVKVQNSVQQTIQNNAALIQRVQPAADDQWVVVLGSDTTLDAAKYETQTAAPKLGISGATIQLRQKLYQSVVIANNRAEAEQVLAKAKSRRADAFIVRLSSWCPNSKDRDGFAECTGP